ncbi:MAG: guanine deaminase [Arenicella sp.]|jgi:guanine deaminase
MSDRKAYRGEILHFLDDPSDCLGSKARQCYEHFDDGILLIENGLVVKLGHYTDLANDIGDDVKLVHYQNGLITPGFIDTHVHYPQIEMIASFGEQLLSWLERYTFPSEAQFSDYAYAKKVAEFFLNELQRNGTTTALVFATSHPESVEAFFDAALSRKLRMICGKVLMDRNAPKELLDTPHSGYQQSKDLIEKWHGRGRLQYAVTPRFAPTSSDAQLATAGRLIKEYPGVYLQTHLSENEQEIEWVQDLFPDSKNYLDVYDKHKLLGRRSVFAHGVHLHDHECDRLSETGSSLAFCPSSNLFLGSGLFNLSQARQRGVNVGLGTDVGAGTSLSLLKTMCDSYKTQQLRGNPLQALSSFYLATLGGARSLDLESTIGNFTVGCEADFNFLDYRATELSRLRISRCNSLEERLFVLSIIGDDRTVGATHIMGERVV